MLHALGVGFRRFSERADHDEEVDDEAMAGTGGVSEFPSGVGKRLAAIGAPRSFSLSERSADSSTEAGFSMPSRT